MKKTKTKEYIPSKWVYVILFTLPVLFSILLLKRLDNDIWYLLAEGRYIVQNGIYHIDPLSIHSGLNVIVQNWLSASLFWITYEIFGYMGIYTLVIICNFFICLFLYKICNLISDHNRILSLLVMVICDLTLASHYIVTRPQVFSFVLLLSVIYVLELYIKTENKKYLIWLPILSIIEVNMHASLWWMIFLFILPYVIDSIYCPLLKLQGYKKKPLFIAIGISLVAGLLNPYFYKGITFIFTSFGDKIMHSFINELLPFSFSHSLGQHIFIVMITLFCLYTYFREGKIRVRYICLTCGTLILGFISVKALSHFILVAFFPIAYLLKDIFPKDFSEITPEFKKGITIFYSVVAILFIGATFFLYSKAFSIDLSENDLNTVMDVMDKYASKETSTVYSSFNNGGYIEYRGYKAYIDPRAELYLKVNNKKEDIFEEFYNLQHNSIDKKQFIKKYNFTHLIVDKGDVLYQLNEEDNNYVIIYIDTEKGLKLLARKDLFTSEQLKSIEKQYKLVVEQAKAKAEEQKNKTGK